MTDSVLLEDSIQYCEVSDIEKYLREYQSDFSDSEIEEMILDKSDYIDGYTNRAWRQRKIISEEYPVVVENHTYRINQPKTSTLGDYGNAIIPLGRQQVDNIEEIIIRDNYREKTLDLTSERVQIDENDGIVYLRVGIWGHFKNQEVRAEVTYTYDETSIDPDKTIPRDIKNACAKLVVADIVESDIYGTVTPANTSNDLDAGSMADQFRQDAMETLDKYKYRSPIY